MNWRDHVATNPNICRGQACIKGTRIPVSVVLDNLAAGSALEEIIASYPALTGEAIRVATAYAVDLARERIIDISGRSAA